MPSTRILVGDPDLFGHREPVAFGTADVLVRPIHKDTADDLIRAGHYSGSVVWSSNRHFGVFHHGRLIGALQYGPAMNPASGGKVVRDCRPGEWLELNRMWLADEKPANCATRAIAYSLRLLRHRLEPPTWVQAFADSRCGKLGAVYQAASFLYLGSHETTFYELDGEWFHKSMRGRPLVDKRGWRCGPKIRRFLANEDRAVPHTFTQYRYAKFLRRGARKRLRMPVLPYPKVTP